MSKKPKQEDSPVAIELESLTSSVNKGLEKFVPSSQLIKSNKNVYAAFDPLVMQEGAEGDDDGTANSLTKSLTRLLDGSKGSVERLAFEADPSRVNQYHSLYKAKLRLIPDTILKRIAIQDDLVASIINTRGNQTSAFGRPQNERFDTGYKIVPKKGVLERCTPEQKLELSQRIEKATQLLRTCGNTDGWDKNERLDFSQFLYMSTRYAIVVGRVATEIVWTQDFDTKERKFHSFRVIDAGTIYRSTSQKAAADNVRRQAVALLENLKNKKLQPEKYINDEYVWVQVIEGKPVQAFTSDECVVQNFYPTSDVELDGYPVTPLDTVISAVTTHVNITSWNKLYFQNGRAARGMIVINSSDLNEGILQRIRQQFQASINSVSNCISGDTQIITHKGAYNIADFLGDNETRMTRVWTGTEWCEAMAYKVKEKKQLCKLELNNGITMKCSPDHRFWTIGENGPEWKKQSEIKLGDYLAVNKKEASNNDIIPELNGKKLNEDIMEVLGWMTGDGSISGKTIKLYYHQEKERVIWKKHEKVLQEFSIPCASTEKFLTEKDKDYLKEQYGFKNVADSRISNTVNSSEFIKKVLDLGFTVSSRSENGKTIPPFVYTLPSKLKASFLRGFFSADGTNTGNKNPIITICNDRLREQTKLLLLSMGIRTNHSEGKTKCTFIGKERALVNAKSYLRIKDKLDFFDKIGFIQDHKQPVELKGTNKNWGTNNKLPRHIVLKYMRMVKETTKLPRGGNDHNFGLDRVFSPREQMNIDAVLRDEDSCSLTRLLHYMKIAEIPVPSWMVDYHYEPVISNGSSDELVQMYDTTVYDKGHGCTGLECKSDKHSLITNGLYTHQSHRMPVFGLDPEDKISWVPIDSGTRDMEFSYLVDQNARSIFSAFQMSPEEVPGWSYLSKGSANQSLSESNQEYKLEAARDLGIRPLLKRFEDHLNTGIFTLMDPKLSQLCEIKFIGLDAETEEKQSVRLQQDSPLHFTYNNVLEKVEKTTLPQEMAANYPFNPAYQAALDKLVTVGKQQEYFLGIKGAGSDPMLDFYHDALWLQYQQLLLQKDQWDTQKAQMKQQADQAALLQQQQQSAVGSPADDGRGGDSLKQDQNSRNGNNGAKQLVAEQESSNLTRSLDQAIGLMSKSEGNLPSSKKRLLIQHKRVVENNIKALEEDMKSSIKEILKAISKDGK